MTTTPAKKLSILADGYELSLTPAMIEEVVTEWEQENPGRNAIDMGSDEFADRCMEKLYGCARKFQ